MSLTISEILNLIPQQKPFRFIDEISAIDGNSISGNYTFKVDEVFYAGHFPSQPITPGVILLESMGQIGIVAFGLYLLSLEFEPAEIKNWLTLFTDAEVEFAKPVLPGEKVLVYGRKIFWRRMKLRTEIEMYNESGNLIASANASGMGVRKNGK